MMFFLEQLCYVFLVTALKQQQIQNNNEKIL